MAGLGVAKTGLVALAWHNRLEDESVLQGPLSLNIHGGHGSSVWTLEKHRLSVRVQVHATRAMISSAGGAVALLPVYFEY